MRAVDTTNGQLSTDLIAKVEGEDGLRASIHLTFHWSTNSATEPQAVDRETLSESSSNAPQAVDRETLSESSSNADGAHVMFVAL